MGPIQLLLRSPAASLVALAILAAGVGGSAQSPPVPAEPTTRPAMAPHFARWLEEVRPIISGAELALFLQLRQDYQREAFIDQFWRVRDPYPETARNEMRERFEERLHQARSRYSSLDDDRARILLVHGEPHREVEIRCTTSRVPAIIWAYGYSDEVDFGFLLVFLRDSSESRPARIWRPEAGAALDGVVRAARQCMNGSLLDEVAASLSADGLSYDIKLDRVLSKPRPRSLEWVASFYAGSTELPASAGVFGAKVTVDYLGRYQSRTVLQGIVSLSPSAVVLADLAGHRSYDLQLVGEVIREGRLLERFRYKFGFPEARAEGRDLALLFQRYLRPGPVSLILRVEDLNGGTFFREERDIDVPQLEEEFVPTPILDTETARIFAEAAAAMARGDASLRLIPPAEGVRTGFVRFDTMVSGEISRVDFFLDEQLVLTKTRPPFNVELDLGSFPRPRTVRAIGFDALGVPNAEDEVEVNGGGHRFSVRLVEPGRDRRYEGSLLARVEVRPPEGAMVERVEFFVNETKAATLYQEPFRQPLELSDPGKLAYVRAVAYLADGNTAEDHVFVNAPAHLEEVEVQYVELFASVQDRAGRPIDDLGRGSFSVLEDGVEQSVARFEQVRNLPIHVGILLDNSASMQGALETARRAALSFLESAIESQDRAAIITFNRFPNLAVKLTNDHRELGGGLAGLSAEGQTALYDSLMFALYYFTGVSGQRAILLLSDGRDEVSRFSFEETLEYAQRAGVTVYAIGLGIPEGGGRRALQRLAEVTGGQSYFTQHADELPGIYGVLQRELRSQYLLTYQSSNTASDDVFRSVEVKVDIPGARVRAVSGYFP